MTWITDLGLALGLPGAGTTLAVGMYSACVAAERAARPEALKAIGDLLRDPSWERSAQPSVAINRVFIWTFGEYHLSWKCIRRSLLATLIVATTLFLWFLYDFDKRNRSTFFLTSIYRHPFIFLAQVILLGAISDYISLAKSSSCLIKIITPLHEFTGWFFDVSTHPLQAVGIVTGCLIMFASFILTFL